jgi:hypothetical protein
VTLHTDAQRAAFSAGHLPHDVLGVLDLRQQSLRD